MVLLHQVFFCEAMLNTTTSEITNKQCLARVPARVPQPDALRGHVPAKAVPVPVPVQDLEVPKCAAGTADP